MLYEKLPVYHFSPLTSDAKDTVKIVPELWISSQFLLGMPLAEKPEDLGTMIDAKN